MRPDDFFVENESSSPWDTRQLKLNQNLLEQVHVGTVFGHSDTEVAVALARLVHDEFVSRGTRNNPRIDSYESRGTMSALRAVLGRLHIPFSPPFVDFDSFYEYWRSEGASGSGGWSARRAILRDLFDPIHNQLADLEAGSLKTTLAQPVTTRTRTGWTRVDEEIAELRRHFQNAQTPQDYRNIGLDCVIVIERLSEAAYVASRHLDKDDIEPPVGNTKVRLDRVIEVDFTGPGNAELRKLVRAAIEQAQAVKHRTPDRRQAGVAADSVVLLASILRRLTEPTGV